MRHTRRLVSAKIMALTLILATGCDGHKPQANIALGPTDSASQRVSRLILDAYHLDAASYQAHSLRFGDALTGVQDGSIDISMGFLGLPSTSIDSLQAATGDVKLLSLSDEVIRQLEQVTDYRRYVIPKGSYLFLDQDVQTITAYAVLMANTHSISDEMAYQLARVMYDKAASIPHAQARFLTLKHALDGGANLRIHPGAKRFYEEQGLTVTLPVAELALHSNKREFILGSGSQGGTYYPLGGEMATRWNQAIPGINVTNVATEASIENLVSLGDNKIDLAMTVNVSAAAAQAGSQEFTAAPIDNAAFIGQLYPEVFHIVTRATASMSSFDALRSAANAQ